MAAWEMTASGYTMERRGMIDLHIHLLPGVDDGASTIEVATDMIAGAKRLGYTTLVATPHLMQPLTSEYRAMVEEAHAQIAPIAAAYGIELHRGFEVMLTPDIPERLATGEPLTLGSSRAVLVELPFVGWAHHTEQTLQAIAAQQYRPVLAHVERYTTFQQDPARAEWLAMQGLTMHVNIGSLIGLFGKRAQALAERLILGGHVQLVATDAHSAGQRLQAVTGGLTRLDRLVGPAEVIRMTAAVPRALLNDDPLPKRIPTIHQRDETGFFGRLRRSLAI